MCIFDIVKKTFANLWVLFSPKMFYSFVCIFWARVLLCRPGWLWLTILLLSPLNSGITGIFSKFCSFGFYIQIYDFLGVNFCTSSEVRVEVLFCIFILNFFKNVVEKQLAIYVHLAQFSTHLNSPIYLFLFLYYLDVVL